MASPAEIFMRGPLLGTFFGIILYGIVSMQVIYYVQNYSNDRSSLKFMVAVIWILETTQAAFSMYAMDYYLIVNFSNPNALSNVNWELTMTCAIGSLVDYVSNMYFAWRIWKLSEKLYIPIIIAFVSTGRCGVAIATCVYSLLYRTSVTLFRHHTVATLSVCNVTIVVSDVLIACAFMYYLHRGRSGLDRMDRLVNRLLAYILGTNLLTSFVGLATMLLFF
ncbi:hypothetical protein SERLADRAFT_459344 [Serpula lacrymans var. lacrymans S7.9]|uniref:DUF6534 domain-containing protein n=1 Tax=Serpula lacrymans var. lacrymans (strain S7.9) TaxID=578457 RepID=F8NJT8_SERL9|nr:uncharacterized protein SERLADRAFT_459344 [Serpula lacrymans var. lacrymans S7.9]EGO28674.1 hypothetical protein SERLADRAFT_459344 [Serpula lacrymans var. lacrymans S7.9]